jgi:hypothetical protein
VYDSSRGSWVDISSGNGGNKQNGSTGGVINDLFPGTIPGCSFWNHIVHTRTYGDTGGAMFSVHYGFTVIGTTHRDWGECQQYLTVKAWNASYSGDSYEAEHWIADHWLNHYRNAGAVVKVDELALHNREGWPATRMDGHHKLHNDGAATLIFTAGGPVGPNGEQLACATCSGPPDTGGGTGPIVELTTSDAGHGSSWVSWNSYEPGGGIAFCRAQFVPSGPHSVAEFTIDTAPGGGPQNWTTGPGTLTFTCFDTRNPQLRNSASAQMYG